MFALINDGCACHSGGKPIVAVRAGATVGRRQLQHSAHRQQSAGSEDIE
jgi:hypothetical protein